MLAHVEATAASVTTGQPTTQTTIRRGWSRAYLALVDGALPKTLAESLRRFHAMEARWKRTGKAKGGVVHPGWTRMARELGVRSISTARIHAAALQELGLLLCVQRGGGRVPGTRKGRAHLWTVSPLGVAYLGGNEEAHGKLQARLQAAPIRARHPSWRRGDAAGSLPAEKQHPGTGLMSRSIQEGSPTGAHSQRATPPAAGTPALTAAVEALRVSHVVKARITRLDSLRALPAQKRHTGHPTPTPPPETRQEVTQEARMALLVEAYRRGEPLEPWDRRGVLAFLGVQ